MSTNPTPSDTITPPDKAPISSAPSSPSAPEPDSMVPPSSPAEQSNDPAVDPVDKDNDIDTPVQQNVKNNSGTMIGIQVLQEIQRLHGTPLSPKIIGNHLSNYADPKNIRKIVRTLDSHRVVVLYSSPGTGRYTTAVNLLHQRTKDRIRQVRREPNEKFSFEGSRDENTGWILDLRDENEKQSDDFSLNLASASDALRERGSYLVVVTHPALWDKAGRKAPYLGINLFPPSAPEVLSKHLGIAEIPTDTKENPTSTPALYNQTPSPQGHPEHTNETQNINATFPEEVASETLEKEQQTPDLHIWLNEPRVLRGIANLVPAEVVTWAQNILQVEKNENESLEGLDPEDQHQKKVDFVVNAANDWRSALRVWHEQNTESEYRNYLLAAAALDGAPVETIRKGAVSLASAFGENFDEKPGQQGKGIIELTYAINAELTTDDTVQFTRPGYAKAVVDYFWIDRPTLVADFTRWTSEQAASLPENVAQQLADRVSEWALRYCIRKRSVALLRDIAEQWSSTGELLLPYARDLLTAAAMDPDLGQRARNAFLDWAKEDVTETTDKTKHLKIALTETCGQLGAVFPKTMLRRLTEMASSPDSQVTESVGRILSKLWEQPDLRSRLQKVLQGWDESGQPAQRIAAHRAFVHLAARPDPFSTPPVLSDVGKDSTGLNWIIDRWRGVLETKATWSTQNTFNDWMDSAIASTEYCMKILQIFHHAVHRPTEENYNANRYLNLSHLLNTWEPPKPDQLPTERTHLRDKLLTHARDSDPARLAPNTNAQTP